jgi:hypothetical protein
MRKIDGAVYQRRRGQRIESPTFGALDEAVLRLEDAARVV